MNYKVPGSAWCKVSLGTFSGLGTGGEKAVSEVWSEGGFCQGREEQGNRGDLQGSVYQDGPCDLSWKRRKVGVGRAAEE